MRTGKFGDHLKTCGERRHDLPCLAWHGRGTKVTGEFSRLSTAGSLKGQQLEYLNRTPVLLFTWA
jgi:hypothetical protein